MNWILSLVTQVYHGCCCARQMFWFVFILFRMGRSASNFENGVAVKTSL